MTTGSQLIALLRSYIDSDEEHFFSVALQIAASEARRGHRVIAQELKELVDKGRQKQQAFSRIKEPTPLAKPKGELSSLLSVSYPELHLNDMILADTVLARLERVIIEHRNKEKLLHYGQNPRNKLLLVGHPGTGKTMTAKVLAGELHLPLFTIRLEGLITKFMGETASKLRVVFDTIAQCPGVYLFDEFDAIGGKRDASNDVGEMRRVLNSFLQLMEEGAAFNSVLVAATNHPELLDRALFRRFDDVVEYMLPDKESIHKVIQSRLVMGKSPELDWSEVEQAAVGLSQAEIVRAAEEVQKAAILSDQETINSQNLIQALQERHAMRDTIAGLTE